MEDYGHRRHKLQVYGPKNRLSEFVDLNDTSYKFMDQKNTISKLMDLSDALLQVGGPAVHFTLVEMFVLVSYFSNLK